MVQLLSERVILFGEMFFVWFSNNIRQRERKREKERERERTMVKQERERERVKENTCMHARERELERDWETLSKAEHSRKIMRKSTHARRKREKARESKRERGSSLLHPPPLYFVIAFLNFIKQGASTRVGLSCLPPAPTFHEGMLPLLPSLVYIHTPTYIHAVS